MFGDNKPLQLECECFFFVCVLKFKMGVCVKMFVSYFRIGSNKSNATSYQRVLAHISLCANGVRNECALKTVVFSHRPIDDL